VQQAAAGTATVNSHIGAVTRVVAEIDNRAGVVLDAAPEMTGQATMLEDDAAKSLVAVQEASRRREASIQRRDACGNHRCCKGVTLTLHDLNIKGLLFNGLVDCTKDADANWGKHNAKLAVWQHVRDRGRRCASCLASSGTDEL
jgi:hypothetical protein